MLEDLAVSAPHADVNEAASHQLQTVTNHAGITMLPVPGKSYSLGIFPVTNAQFRLWQAGHDSSKMFRGCTKSQSGMDPLIANADDAPVVCVTFEDALGFCNWLSQKGGRKYRLPTRGEWRHAMQAGTADWYRRNHPCNSVWCWFRWDHLGRFQKSPRAFGEALPNPWGFYDMLGNVFQWVIDTPTEEDIREQRRAEAASRRVVGPGLEQFLSGPIHLHAYHRCMGLGWSNAFEKLLVSKDEFREGVIFFSGFEHGMWEDNVGFRVLCEP
jgi:formylglycine-generating enzyme required for sulfatase activity